MCRWFRRSAMSALNRCARVGNLSAAFLGRLLPAQAMAADPYPGYTLFSTTNTAYLYNMKKEKVHEWKVAAGTIQTSTYLLPDGSMLFPLNRGGVTFRHPGAHAS